MYTAKFVLFHQGSTELRRCENCVFFLPVNILTGLRAGFLGRTTHYRVSCAFIPPSVCQISRQSDIVFAFYSSFCKCAKRGRKIRRKKNAKKLSQFLKSHISGTLEAISLKFGKWSTEGGGSVHSKIRLFSSRQHRATEVRKLRFLSSCQYTYGCCAPASWAARHTTVCLDLYVLICTHQCSK